MRILNSYRPVLLAAIFALGIKAASAKDIYIAQNASGGANGQDCADALAATFFNASGNWGTGASQIGPGTTVHLCGTFTGGPGATALTFQGSGASGNPITLLFEPNAVLQAPYWAASGGGFGGGAIVMSTFGSPRSYITVDGGTNGTIQNTANGDGLANQQDSEAISAWECANCVIRNLKISNIYVHSNPSSNTTDETKKNCIEFSGSNWTISGNVFHDVGWCLFHGYTNGNDSVEINNNEIYNFTHGYALMGTQNGGPAITNISFHDNYLHDTYKWDTVNCAYHHDGIHVFGTTTPAVSSINGLYVYNNYFAGNWGSCQTGQVFVEANYNDANLSNSAWWNNVFVEGAGSGPSYTGVFGLFSGKSGTTQVYNNTCITSNASDGASCYQIQNITGLTFKNNLASNVNNPIGIARSTFSAGAVDYNYYGGPCSGGNCFSWGSGFSGSLAAWQTACGCDSHAVQNSLLALNADGSPQTGAAPAAMGTDLASLAVGRLAALASDTTQGGRRTPSPRPSGTTPWTPGAYSLSSGSGGGTNPPAPPTGLSATVK
ncbi:MAG TPA: hypothetical protein VHB50_09105 [Bryobacteraceae bacterium]|nr:hypothetical protein [Bryobacteraceae bacterium]